MLYEAIKFAVAAHGDTRDRGGDLAILHPLAVMLSMETEEEMIVAILHDTVEDTPATLDSIGELFGSGIRVAVDALTRREDEKYFDYIDRVGADSLARKVKLADLAHNSSPARLNKLSVAERGIIKRYNKAVDILART